jgi:hypothetical protein
VYIKRKFISVFKGFSGLPVMMSHILVCDWRLFDETFSQGPEDGDTTFPATSVTTYRTKKWFITRKTTI